MDRLVKWFAVLLLLWFAAGCTEPLIQTDHGTLAATETGTQDRAADKVSDKASVKRFTACEPPNINLTSKRFVLIKGIPWRLHWRT